MSIGDAPGDGESEARAPCLTRTGLVHTVEAFAKMWQVIDCDANAGVGDLQDSLSLFPRRSHLDMTAAAIVFDRVVEQSKYCLFEQCRISNPQRCIIGFFPNTDPCLDLQGLYAPRSRAATSARFTTSCSRCE